MKSILARFFFLLLAGIANLHAAGVDEDEVNKLDAENLFDKFKIMSVDEALSRSKLEFKDSDVLLVGYLLIADEIENGAILFENFSELLIFSRKNIQLILTPKQMSAYKEFNLCGVGVRGIGAQGGLYDSKYLVDVKFIQKQEINPAQIIDYGDKSNIECFYKKLFEGVKTAENMQNSTDKTKHP